ncbi:PadR family transcriptional regulator [Nakamurella sp. PAMC28650]|uniref:PadR family transcriptional regulator n=1 Tax=Nakamurella sp. PAMC28650 TaxID=2762325 RepID=UPI00210382E1|nr:PadR family transcriptional regulator [Nakamurella sp. PAMC28650]
MHAISQRTEGAWRPSPGAIYPTIAVLEDEQLVSVTAEGGRKLVSLTDSGREYLRDNAGTIADPFTAITADRGGRNDLRSSVDQLHTAARAVADSGTSEQILTAQGILEQTKRSLYLILAGQSITDGPADPTQV